MVSRKVLFPFDVVVGLLVVLQTLDTVLHRGRMPQALVAMELVSTAAMALFWLAWRVTGRRVLLLGLCLSAFLSSSSGGGTGALVLVVSLALVTFGYGSLVGIGTAALLCAFVVVLQVTLWAHKLRRGWVVEDIGSFVILSLGVLVGQMLRELVDERRRNAELVEQVRRSAATEQELMLAGERARSARELHDGLGHQLTLVVLGLEYAERMRERDPDKAFAEVAQAHDTATAALAHMRRWVRALNPPREQRLHGNQAFEAIADSFRGTGLDVVFSHTGAERDLGQRASLFALRLVQEGLTNVLRHAEAGRVELHVDWGADRLRLVLRDDGGPGAHLEPGFGLRSLAERAAELGGHFRATSTEAGVELFAEVPLEATR